MEFRDVVQRRRMVRSYLDRPVAPEVVDRLLDAAIRAPSAGFSQGWAFVVLEGDQTDVFWETCTDEGWTRSARREGLEAAPVLIIPLAHKQAYLDRYSRPDKAGTGMDREEQWPVPYWLVDTAFASMNILLAATDEGLGALFFGIFRGEQALMDRLGVPNAYKAIGVIAVGHPDPGDRPSPSLKLGKRGLDAVVHRGRWGGGS